MPRTSLRSRLEAAEDALAKLRERDANHTLTVPVKIDAVATKVEIAELGRAVDRIAKKVAKLRAAVTVTCARLYGAAGRIDHLIDED